MICAHGVEYEDMCQECYREYDELCKTVLREWDEERSRVGSLIQQRENVGMGTVKSVTALALADRVFAAPKAKEAEEQETLDLAVYAKVEYNVNNDGNVHLVIPGNIALASLQQKKTAKHAAFVQVKAESVDVNITQELPDGKSRETVLTTKPVEFELRFMFDAPESAEIEETPVTETK